MSKEYPCVYYEKKLCKKFSKNGFTSFCVMGPCPHETPSNADRIRSMSDEKLADFLAYTWATSARAWQKDSAETLFWLQQPAEEDSNG